MTESNPRIDILMVHESPCIVCTLNAQLYPPPAILTSTVFPWHHLAAMPMSGVRVRRNNVSRKRSTTTLRNVHAGPLPLTPPPPNRQYCAPLRYFVQANAQIMYAEGIEMALEQLGGGGDDSGTTASSTSISSREELSVLRGIAEELGLLGGAEAARNFASAFGVKQVRFGSGPERRVVFLCWCCSCVKPTPCIRIPS